MSLTALPLRRLLPLVLTLAVALLLGACATTPSTTRPDAAPAVTADSSSPFYGWAQRSFPGKAATRYRIVQVADLPGANQALRTEADRSASMFFRRLDPTAAQPTRVSFGWKVEVLPSAASLGKREAEDSAVRVILAFDGDAARLPMRDRMLFELAHAVTGETPPFAMLMYVWDVTSPVGEVVQSNSTSRIRKIVLNGADSALGQWHLHERDIVEDFRRAYGEPPGPLIGVGVMSDADNTASRVLAWYSPVRLLAPSSSAAAASASPAPP